MTPPLLKYAACTSMMVAATLLSGCGGGGDGSASASAMPTISSNSLEQPTSAALAVAGPTVRALAVTTAATATPTLTVRARASLAGNIGPIMEVRIDGVAIGRVEVRSTATTPYSFSAPTLHAGAKVDIVYTNDGGVNGQDRNLYILDVQDANSTILPTASFVTYDRGSGSKATDGIDTIPGQGEMFWSGALRFAWPTSYLADSTLPRKNDAARFLQQATFGPTPAEITRLAGMSLTAWLDEQMAMPAKPDFLNYIQSKYDLGDPYRPYGIKYNHAWVNEKFWNTAATSPDQLRKRAAFALHQIFMASLTDSNLWLHARAYADYVDTLNRDAFGNFRTLLEDMALSPTMGNYLSHIRNRKEDPTTERSPDENFAREIMQLFTIGLYELNDDGTPKRDSSGRPIETYGNADVMGLAKVFTGWSWAFPDSQLSDYYFRYVSPDYSTAKDQRVDLLKMRPYPGQHSTAEVKLFTGKSQAVTIPSNTSATDSLKIALDTLFNHPNVGPFIGRQLIQRLVTSNPSPAYVARVAAVFNNNGKGVRGDMGAVFRAVLLDSEARSAPTAQFGKVREPVLRVTQWIRAFGATSLTGNYQLSDELATLSQRPFYATTVFGYFRPNYVPPNTQFATSAETEPELQIVNESTVATWVNLAEAMVTNGIGWTGNARDVTATLAAQAALVANDDIDALVENMNLLLFAGNMSQDLRLTLRDAVIKVPATALPSRAVNRARVAVFLAMASSEYLVQR